MDIKKNLILLLLISSLIMAKKMQTSGVDVKISKENLYKHVESLVNTPQPRNFYNVASLDSAAAYIKAQFEEFGYTPEEQVFTVEGREYRNIIALIGPENTRRIVIGAHYDVCGDQDGADDNASAVAGLLELARVAKEHDSLLTNQIEFVAYTLEEPPNFGSKTMGSYVHAKSLKDKNVDVEVMICLEMIGYFTDEKTQRYPLPLMGLFYPKQGNFIAVVGNGKSKQYIKKVRDAIRNNSTIVCRSLTAPSFVTGVDFSDHRNYWKFGYKALMITDTSFYRNLNYHTIYDTIDTLDFEKMAEVVKGVAGFIIK